MANGTHAMPPPHIFHTAGHLQQTYEWLGLATSMGAGNQIGQVWGGPMVGKTFALSSLPLCSFDLATPLSCEVPNNYIN